MLAAAKYIPGLGKKFAVQQGEIEASSLDHTAVKVMVEDQLLPGIAGKLLLNIPTGATGDVDFVLSKGIRVLDTHVIKRSMNAGVFANTIQLKNAANAISDAISINGVNVGGVVRAASIAPAQYDVAAGGTLRVTRTLAGGDAAVLVVVDCVRI